MDSETYQRGRQIRSEVLGKEYVDKAIAQADDSPAPYRISSPNTAGARYGDERA